MRAAAREASFFCLNAAPARVVAVDPDLTVVNRYELESLSRRDGRVVESDRFSVRSLYAYVPIGAGLRTSIGIFSYVAHATDLEEMQSAMDVSLQRFAEDADLIGALREQMWSSGLMTSTARKGKRTEGEKFKDYFDFSEPFTKLPSHRILAMFRGEKEEGGGRRGN